MEGDERKLGALVDFSAFKGAADAVEGAANAIKAKVDAFDVAAVNDVVYQVRAVGEKVLQFFGISKQR